MLYTYIKDIFLNDSMNNDADEEVEKNRENIFLAPGVKRDFLFS